jgi:peptide/nickel transport system permease protein
MLRFFASKLLRALATVLAVVTFAFVILRLSGDPALTMLGPEAPPDAIAAFRAAWGLDEPLWRQYIDYIAAVLRGDLGVSMRDRKPAIDLVLARLPDTLALMLPAFALKLVIGVPAGIYAALHRDTWIDRTTMAFSVAGYSIPNFVLGLMLVLLFAVQLRWLPSSGWETWQHLVLPVIVLGTAGAGILARFTRSTMLEVLGQPYVRTAIAKGVPWYRVVNRHALPNAAIPTVTVVGFMVGSLIAGAVVTESVFAWPGIGRQLVIAVSQRDVAVVQVILLLVAASMVASNLAVDMLYGWLDPRVRTTQAKDG